jgi:cytoskeletal protein RodZ
MSLNLGLGEYLKKERERKSYTLEQIASATKININILRSLEADEFDKLPAKPFIRGFVISYCKIININPEEVLIKYDSYIEERSSKTHKRIEDSKVVFVDKDSSIDKSKTLLKSTMIAFAIMGLVVIVFVKPALKKRRHIKKEVIENNEKAVTVLPPTIIQDISSSTTKSASSSSTPSLNIASEVKNKDVSQSNTSQDIDSKTIAKITSSNSSEPTSNNSDIKTSDQESSVVLNSKTITQSSSSSQNKIESKPALVKAINTSTEKTDKILPTQNIKPAPFYDSSLSSYTEKIYKSFPLTYEQAKEVLIIQAKENAWVRYQVDSGPIYHFRLKKGQKIFLKGKESIRFATGNPENLEVSFYRKAFEPFPAGQNLIVLPKSDYEKYKDKPFVIPNNQN